MEQQLKENEPEIEITEDAVVVETAEDQKPEPQAEAPQPPPAPQVDPAAEVKAQLAEARRIAAEAQAERDKLRQIAAQKDNEARAASSDAQLQQYNMLVGTIHATEQQLQNLEEKAQQAIEVCDGRLHAQITRQIASLSTKLEYYADAKSAIEEQAEAQRQAAERAAKQPRPPAVRPQSAAAAQNLTPESQRWLAAHPEVLQDPAKTSAVVRAHHVALDQGLVQDSPAYFAFIEQKLGYRQMSDTRPTQRGYAAPVSRDAGTTPNTNPNRVKLTAQQVQFAEQMGERMGLTRDAAIKRYAAGVIKSQERARNR